MIQNAVICSAGMGSRLEKDIPKGIVEINQKSLIAHQLEVISDIPNIYVVVGYKADLMTNEIKRLRPDAHICVNSAYATTNVVDSLKIGFAEVSGSFVYIDGDLLIDRNSFNRFLTRCEVEQNIVCYCDSKTEDAVFVELDESNLVVDFRRTPKTNFEWCGVALFDYEFAKAQLAEKSNCYVYQLFTDDLPLAGYHLECHEIDTPYDLENAMKWSKMHNWALHLK